MEDLLNLPREKAIIAEVLNIPNDNSWQIIDKLDDLRLIYYSQKKSKIRGQIIDIEARKLVVPVYGQDDSPIIEVVSSKISDKLIDTNLEEYKLADNFKIEKGIEGTILRVFKYKDRICYCTQKRIDASKSRWITTPTFLEMYEELGGIEPLFFDDEVYYFLLSHQAVQQASYNFKASKIYFLEAKGNYNLNVVEDLKVLFPKEESLTLEEANYHLQPKVLSDYRAERGDFLIVRGHDQIRDQDFIFKVLSRSYYWRLKITNNDPNINHLWYYHSSTAILGSKFSIDDEEFEKLYLIPKEIKNIDELSKLDFENLQLADFEYQSEVSLNRGARICVVFFNLLFCLPIRRRRELFEVYKKYLNDKQEVAKKIFNDYQKGVKYDLEKEASFERILSQSLKYTQEKKNSPKQSPKNSNIQENIQWLVNNEAGSSLYKMVKAIQE